MYIFSKEVETDLSIYVNTTHALSLHLGFIADITYSSLSGVYFLLLIFPPLKATSSVSIYLDQSSSKYFTQNNFLAINWFYVKIFAALFGFLYIYFLIFNALLIVDILTFTLLSISFFWISSADKILSFFSFP